MAPKLPRLAEIILNNLPNPIKFNNDNCPTQLKCSNDSSFVIGLSGGVDSVVLMHSFYKLKQVFGFNLQAIHINHNISANATQWENFCIDFCNQLNIPLTVFQHKVNRNGGESLENNARKLRYQSFAEFCLNQNTTPIVVLAHHQNDQIETILSQVLRGSDLHNIAGMEHVHSKTSKVNSQEIQQIFWRPLLNITKKEILDYAQEYKLEYINDESNIDNTYLRNFLRNEIIPELQQWDINLNNKILKYQQNIKKAVTLIDELAVLDFNNTVEVECSHGNSGIYKAEKSPSIITKTIKGTQINVNKFKELSATRQQNLISYFILHHQQPLPSSKQITEFCQQITKSKWEKTPELILSLNSSIKKHKLYIAIEVT